MKPLVYPDRKVMVLPARTDVLRLLPHAKPIQAQGRNLMVVPHVPEVTRLLFNLGIKTPEPIRYYYDWAGTTPFDSQMDTAAMLTTHRRAFVLNEMGTGKTRAALYAYDFLKKLGRVKKALVIAPLSTLRPVWENEVFRTFYGETAVVLHGSRNKRLQLLKSPADIFIINHDGVGVIQEHLIKENFDLIIVDELAVYRNTGADRWKNLKPLVRPAKYAWGLTGAPTPNDPTDAYAQVKLLLPENVGFSFKSFKESTMYQVSNFRWIPREDANDIVFSAMQPSIRVLRADCMDLPPVTYSDRSVELDKRAVRAYKEMLAVLATEVNQKGVTAVNEGVKLSKLLQISAGFAYTDEKKGEYVGGVARIREVFNIVEAASHKVIVFCPYRFLVDVIGKALSRRWDTAVVTGDTPATERDRIFTSFQNSFTPHVIVAHPATMAHGLTLTAADTIVWAAPINSLEIYEQANARITRPGQSAHTHIIHVTATSAETKCYSRLRRKAKLQGALLELFEEQT